MDSSIPQRVTLSDGRMAITGVATRFVQVPGRRITMEAIALEPLSGHVLREGAFIADERITGLAWLPEDGLGLAGLAEEASEMVLAVRPLPEGGTAARILLVLAHDGEEPGFHSTLWLPATMFFGLKQEVEAGRAGRLSVIATTNLWLDEADREAPADRRVTWRIGPAQDEAGSAPARGLVERIEWGAARPQPPPEPVAEMEEPAEPVSEMLGRINWSLKQIALLLIFLLIVAALK